MRGGKTEGIDKEMRKRTLETRESDETNFSRVGKRSVSVCS